MKEHPLFKGVDRRVGGISRYKTNLAGGTQTRLLANRGATFHGYCLDGDMEHVDFRYWDATKEYPKEIEEFKRKADQYLKVRMRVNGWNWMELYRLKSWRDGTFVYGGVRVFTEEYNLDSLSFYRKI